LGVASGKGRDPFREDQHKTLLGWLETRPRRIEELFATLARAAPRADRASRLRQIARPIVRYILSEADKWIQADTCQEARSTRDVGAEHLRLGDEELIEDDGVEHKLRSAQEGRRR
jgi:hypothetical protein